MKKVLKEQKIVKKTCILKTEKIAKKNIQHPNKKRISQKKNNATVYSCTM